MDGNGVYGAVRGKDYVPVNQVIDFRANEVEKQVSESSCLIVQI
jgi:hypothetical protein